MSPLSTSRVGSGILSIPVVGVERMIIDPFDTQRINNHPFDEGCRGAWTGIWQAILRGFAAKLRYSCVVYLKTLTLRGFKSFASATRFDFEPGITCVVGPNGSGKSNVVDALAWVMGEQGAKTLRGGKMEDVIFAGTSGRAPLGRAEVSLTIDNTDGALPIEYSEVTLTRTLFRNGGSEYAINGSACRLLDIQDLLSDSGLGREMHVIVGQGQLDGILRATPYERRGFIEEAAGVLKHRKRKEKAQRKLESMQGNLLRLSDLIAELQRQLGPLGRQANAARRSAAIAAIVRDSGLRLLADDLTLAGARLEDAERRHRELKATTAQNAREFEDAAANLEQVEQSLALTRAAQSRAEQLVHTFERQREQLRSIASLAQERARNLGVSQPLMRAEGQQDIQANIARATTQRDDAQVTLTRLKAEVLELESERTRNAEHVALLANRSKRAADAENARRAELSAAQSAVAAAESRLESLEQASAGLRAEIGSAATRLEQLRSGALESGQGAMREPGEDLAGRASELEQSAALAAQAVKDQRLLVSALRAEHLELERQVASRSAQSDLVDAELARMRSGAGRVVEGDSRFSYVAESLTVRDEFSVAIAAVLGELNHGVLSLSREDARSALAAGEAAQDADAISFLFPAEHSAARPSNAELPEGVWRALDLVELHDSTGALEQLLGRVVVCTPEALERALDSASTVLAAGGAVVTTTGVVHRENSLEVVSADTSLAETAKRAEELKHELEVLSAKRDETGAQLARELEQSQAHDAELDGLTKQLTAARIAVSEARSAEANHRALIGAQEAELQRLNARAQASKESIDKAGASLATARDRLDRITGSSTESGSTPAPSAEELSLAQDHLERAREAETLGRLDLRTAQERLTTTENRLAGLQRAARAEEAAAKSAAAAAEKRTRQRAVALEVAARASDGLALMERSLAEATQMRDLAQHNAQEQGEQRNRLRASRDTLDTATRSNTIALHEVELALAELRAAATTLERRAVDDYALSPAQVTDQYGPMELVPAYVFPKVRGGVGEEESPLAADLDPSVVFSRDAVEKAHDKAVRVLAGMGKVNPLALEEYAALEERHRFLSEQLGDLKRSRADLLGLIDDIDAKVLEVFESAFTDTAKQFESVFSRLFPGGEGRMYLTDPDDMLNTGIEIEARPAGKKVKRLSLLSGGERSLTAIAMLVSIFKARPSPFYVMDEVEAALDDINLGRLLGVFRELQEDSQLIVISHQKRTMEIADALYGVTMAGNGVSSVMGTRLQPQET